MDHGRKIITCGDAAAGLLASVRAVRYDFSARENEEGGEALLLWCPSLWAKSNCFFFFALILVLFFILVITFGHLGTLNGRMQSADVTFRARRLDVNPSVSNRREREKLQISLCKFFISRYIPQVVIF